MRPSYLHSRFRCFIWLLAVWLAASSSVLAQNAPIVPRPTGLQPPTAKDLEWMEANLVKVGAVQLNKLAQDRINDERQKRGLIPLSLPLVPHGEEVIPRGSRVTASVGANGNLPAAVDNSTLPSFPPVRNQGEIGSCASFSTTYYVGTHMLGLARGWDNRNENNATKLSPKWTYPMVNGGQDNGSWFTPTIDVLLKHGGATWADWPYNPANTPSSYREWNRSAAVWRNALNNRMAQAGVVRDIHTAIGLQNLKTLLANGYALLYATEINGWQYTTISDDTGTTADDAFVGKSAVTYMQAHAGGHAMTVVGYNDNLWIDINKNGTVDPGEKGALRVCNSWGVEWKDDGFMWIAYDALRTTTAVPGVSGQTNRAPSPASPSHTPWWYNEAYWFTAQVAYVPKLLAQFTLNHKSRSELRVRVGVSAAGTTAPTTYSSPGALQNQGGGFSYDGTTTAVNGTFVFDCTDIATSGSRRYYLSVADTATGNTASVSDFRLTDATGNTLAVATTGIPGAADNSTTLAYVDYSLNAPVITSATTTTGTVGTTFSFQTVASGATTFGASGLPPGLSINGTSGLISGTPTQAGTFTVGLSASSTSGSGSGALTVVVTGPAVSPPVILSAATATGTVGTTFTYTIAANGSPTGYGASGLPSGLTVNTATGIVSGTPALPGTFQVGLSAVNVGGTGARTLTLTINPAPASAPVITSAATASVNAGSPFSYRITASNSPSSFGADGLPAELTLNTSSGLISGTPTLARQHAVTLRAINASGTGYQNLVLTVLGDSSFGPANDSFANRSVLTGTNVTVTGGNVNATAQTGEPNHAGNTTSVSVWWTWTAPVSGMVTLDTIGSSFDTVLAAYTGSTVTNLAGVASDDDGGGNRTSRLTFNAVAGTAYQFAVDGYAGLSGGIILNLVVNGIVTQPSNDSFSSALTLTGALVFTGGRNTGASAQSGEPNHAGFTASKSVWWTWTAPASGPVVVGTGGSSFDTLLAVYTGSSVSALTLVASDDQSGGNNTSLLTFSATSGVTYRIAVDGFLGDEGSIVLGLLQLGSAPSNDSLQGAAPLSGFNPTASGVNTNATAQAGEPNHAGYPASKSVWWTWTAPASGLAQIATTGSSFDTVLGVYSGSSLGSLVAVASDDDSGGNLTSRVTFTASAGTIYRIAVDGFEGASGTVALSIALTATPANDSFSSRIALSGTNFSTSGANVNATAQIGEPAHAGSNAVKSVWWSWTAPLGGRVTFRTTGSAFDTVLAVYTGSLVGSLSQVAANDDEPGALTSSVSFIAMAGATYQIAVDGYAEASGTIVLSGTLVVNPDVLYETDFESFSDGLTTITSVDGWLGINAGAGAHGILTALDSRAGYLGFNPPASSSVLLYRPVNFQPVAQGRPMVNFSVDFSVFDSTAANGQYDDFGFSIYNRSGQLLSTIRLDNSNLRIYYNNGAATDVDTGRQFTNGTRHRLVFSANSASNLWSATLNGTALFTGIPLNTIGRTLDLGEVGVLWRLKNASAPGDNYIVFDNFALSASAAPFAPAISAQPVAITNSIGGVATFAVTATGSAPLRYQWRFNSAAMTGETNATLNLLNLTANQAGLYSVVVSNSVSFATSLNAALTVSPSAPTTVLGRPVVTSRGLQFQATGTPGRSFKFESSTNLVNWQEISTMLNQNGTLTFLDPSATNSVRKFYRIRDAN